MPFFKKLLARMVNKTEHKFQRHRTRLKPGDKAPAIHGITQDGKAIDMKQFAGRKIVLYFYPEDNTAGCTAQACSLRDNYTFMLKAGYAVIGVSADTVKKHQNFIKKYDLPFPLISDEKHELIKAYDVWGRKQFMGKVYEGIIRTTFVINEEGIIDEVISEVNTAGHASQILK